MAAWDDALRLTLKLAGKSADEIEKIIASIISKGGDEVAKVAVKTDKSAAEVAMMSKAERTAYNASKAIKDREVTGAEAAMKAAEGKLKNVREGEDVINATLGETSKTKLGAEGIAQQFDQYFKKAESASPSTILKRTMNDPDYKALQAAEDKAVAKAEDEVMAAIESAKSAGKPMTEQEIRTLISSKAKNISDEVSSSAKTKAQTDIESIKGRAAEGGRSLSEKEKAAIAKRETVSYQSAKERADEIAAQAKSVAAGGEKSIATRVETLKGLTPEEQRMSGVKGKLYKDKAVAESKGEISFVERLTAMAKDKKLLPIMEDGKQVTEEIIVDGKKLIVPKYETRAEQSLRLEKQKPFKAKDLAEEADGPSPTPKTPEELRNIKANKDSVVTESSAKLRAAQEESTVRGAKSAAESATAPAAKDAFGRITKDYNKGLLTKERYLELIKDVPKIGGNAVTDADMVAIDKKIAETAAKRQAERAAEEAAAAAKKAQADVPKSELKGRKWVRDAAGKLVLVKK